MNGQPECDTHRRGEVIGCVKPGLATLPRVSIVVPVQNEVARIERSLRAILSQDYPRNLTEVLIADGQSDDGTSERIREAIARNPERRIRLLDNPGRTPGAALNLMIRQALGDVVVRVDGHTEIAPDYARLCVAALQTTDAINVGGYISASGDRFMERAIAMALGSFWGNGGARFRSRPAAYATFVDTVPFGAWRRETFARLGLFMEDWRVNEDCEFNARIRDAGGKILLDPAIKSTYFVRGSLHSLAQQYFRYGKMKCSVIARHPRRLRARQLAPPLFVLSLAALIMSAALGAPAKPPLLALFVYLLAISVDSLRISFRARQPELALVLPAVFATVQISYGLGALLGVLRLLTAPLLVALRRVKPMRANGL